MSLDDTDEILSANFNLYIDADFFDNGSTIDYSDTFEYELDVTLNQSGFPILSSEIRSSPLVIDLDNDGDNDDDLIIGTEFNADNTSWAGQ